MYARKFKKKLKIDYYFFFCCLLQGRKKFAIYIYIYISIKCVNLSIIYSKYIFYKYMHAVLTKKEKRAFSFFFNVYNFNLSYFI